MARAREPVAQQTDADTRAGEDRQAPTSRAVRYSEAEMRLGEEVAIGQEIGGSGEQSRPAAGQVGGDHHAKQRDQEWNDQSGTRVQRHLYAQVASTDNPARA